LRLGSGGRPHLMTMSTLTIGYSSARDLGVKTAVPTVSVVGGQVTSDGIDGPAMEL
jgi:hypothetical protein